MAKKKSLAAIEIFTDASKEVRFRIKGGNGEILVQSEGYKDVRNCSKCLKALADVMWMWEMETIDVKRMDQKPKKEDN
jgi:uncharacterized protein YegP (UPF0339 family)